VVLLSLSKWKKRRSRSAVDLTAIEVEKKARKGGRRAGAEAAPAPAAKEEKTPEKNKLNYFYV